MLADIVAAGAARIAGVRGSDPASYRGLGYSANPEAGITGHPLLTSR